MKHSSRILFACLIIFVISIPGFSQENPKKSIAPRADQQSKTDETNEETSKAEGLRKIKTRSQLRDMDVNIHIDQKMLEASIESAIENAMRSVDVALERLEINIEPIEIDLRSLDMDAHPIEINIPDLNINIEIEPVEVDLDIDNEMDQDRFDRDNDDGDRRANDKWKEKSDDEKDTSDRADKDKSKGLKKIK